MNIKYILRLMPEEMKADEHDCEVNQKWITLKRDGIKVPNY